MYSKPYRKIKRKLWSVWTKSKYDPPVLAKERFRTKNEAIVGAKEEAKSQRRISFLPRQKIKYYVKHDKKLSDWDFKPVIRMKFGNKTYTDYIRGGGDFELKSIQTWRANELRKKEGMLARIVKAEPSGYVLYTRKKT